MAEPRVEEFQIKVARAESANEPPSVIVRWRESEAQGHIELDTLRSRTIEVLVGLLRANRLNRIEELKLLGEYLYVTLFRTSRAEGGPSGFLKRAIKTDSLEEDTGRRLLRVSLEIDADVERLGTWPWEYLYFPDDPGEPDSGFFLGERTNFMLTRQLPLAVSQRTISIRPPLRILFVVLSPTDLPDIEYEAVLETLVQLRDSQGQTRIDLRVLTEQHSDNGARLEEEELGLNVRTTYRSFIRGVEDFDPHVVHIIGHGRYRSDGDLGPSGQLAFRRTDSTAGWVPDRELANMLRDSPSLRLVFLQACESAETQSHPYQVISGLAQWLAQKNIPAVIAMHFQVKSMLANEFARSFYEAMVKRATIEVAMHEARRQLYISGVTGDSHRSGFGLPVLYLRGSGALLTPLEVPVTSIEGAGEPRIAELGRPRLWEGEKHSEEFSARSPHGGSGDQQTA
jgi:hypothetical protein